ncbi:MAG: N-acetylmuramoyl-L-alanine amidase [Pseudomonadota bacterium]
MVRFFQFSFFVSLLSLLFFLSGAAHALEITNVRFGEHPDKLRTVIELDQETDYKISTTKSQNNGAYRLFVDLPSFTWSAGEIRKPKHEKVQDIKTSNLGTDHQRIAFDFISPRVVKSAFILPQSGSKPVRLVIDTVKVSNFEFEQSSQKTSGNLKIPVTDLSTIIAQTMNLNTSNIQTPSENSGLIPPKKPSQFLGAAPIKSTPLRKPLIVIDAGHGGVDPGAIGANKMKEKTLTLSAARELKKQLESTGRYRVALTRNDDRYLKLYQRVAIARQKEADLFISIHADSINKPNVRGASIYTLSNKASDKQTAKLAARENQADLIAGVDLTHEDEEVANILIDLTMRDTMNQSKFFANTVVQNMASHNIRALPRPHRFAGFAVLKAPDIPSVLFEMGFMSNSREAKLLATRDYQQRIARSLTSSIDMYFEKVAKNTL